jgi:Flp pilus assembly protein TadD
VESGALAPGVPLRTLGALVLALTVATATLIWAVQPDDLEPALTPAPAAAPSVARGPLAALVQRDAAPPLVPDRVPGVLPFFEPALEGRLAYSRGEYDDALRRFKDEIDRQPSDPSAHSNAGQVLIRLGRPVEALPYLEKAAALDPGRWTYRFNLARGHAQLGQWELAAAQYEEAARLFPEDHATAFNLAQALHRAGREDEAVTQYRRAMALKPDDATFHLALGISEEKRGERVEAVAAYRKFLEMSPEAKEAEGVRARVERLEKEAASAETAQPGPPAAER